MAKKDNKQQAAQVPAKAAELTLDNIEEQIKSLNRSSEDIALAAKEEQAKDDEKEKIRKTRRAQARAKYINMYSVLGMKHRRDLARIDKKLADDTLAARNEIESGKCTFLEFDKKIDKIFEDRDKAIEEADKKFRENKKELDDSFSNSYDTYDIDWKFDSYRGRRLW